MAYSKSPRPYRRYSVMLQIDNEGTANLYSGVRAHDKDHAERLARARLRRDYPIAGQSKHIELLGVFEGTVRRATS